MRAMLAAVALTAVSIATLLHHRPLRAVKATSSDPEIATREEKRIDGVLWGMSYDQALEQSASDGKPVLIYFSSLLDMSSRTMEVNILARADIASLLSNFVAVRLDTDESPIASLHHEQREMIGERNREHELELAGNISTPQFIAVDEKGNPIGPPIGYCTKAEFARFLTRAESSYQRKRGRLDGSRMVWGFGGLALIILTAVILGWSARSRRT